MKSKLIFELRRWIYFVVLFFIGTGLVVFIGEVLAGPLLRWLFYDIPYTLPTMNRVARLILFVIFCSFFTGTVTWYYEKRSSGR